MENKIYIDNVTKEIITQLSDEIVKGLKEECISNILAFTEGIKEFENSFKENNLSLNGNVTAVGEKTENILNDKFKGILDSVDKLSSKLDVINVQKSKDSKEINDLITNLNSSFDSFKSDISKENKNNNQILNDINTNILKLSNSINSSSETIQNGIKDYINKIEIRYNNIEEINIKYLSGIKRSFAFVSFFSALLFLICIIILFKIS